MNLQQLEYIIAVDNHRHFARAAEACHITQATLSMMIKKLEQELEITIFDRSKHPVLPTEIGKTILGQAQVILRESQKMVQLAGEVKTEFRGELKMGIIPTLAPYLLPLFLESFLKKYPLIKLQVVELNTDQIIRQLTGGRLDVGILATPLGIGGIQETPLFVEEFKVYVSKNEKDLNKRFLIPGDIDVNRLWLLEEGHCLRSQVLNLCELQRKQVSAHNLEYQAGSIESLLKIVEINNGITIVPELVGHYFDKRKKRQLRDFRPPVPVRQISFITYRHFVKQKLLSALQAEIISGVRPLLRTRRVPVQVMEIR